MSYMNDMFSTGFGEAIVRFFVCFFVNWIIVHFLYYKKSHRRDFYFTFMIISVYLQHHALPYRHDACP